MKHRRGGLRINMRGGDSYLTDGADKHVFPVEAIPTATFSSAPSPPYLALSLPNSRSREAVKTENMIRLELSSVFGNTHTMMSLVISLCSISSGNCSGSNTQPYSHKVHKLGK